MKDLKIVILDEYPLSMGELSWDELKEYGDLKIYDGRDHVKADTKKTIEKSRDAEIVFTNKVIIDREVIDSLPNLKYIGVLATGYNVVDTTYANKKGITVANVPSYGTDAVAQMCFSLILHITNHVAYHNDQVKDGEWSKRNEWCFWDYPLVELKDKTIGIIGYGSIGRKIGEIAKAFGMKVLATANHPKNELEDSKMKYVNLDVLLKESDIISLNCPLTEDTEDMINKDSIEKMKDGVIIVNTSRGGLIVEEDLSNAIKRGKIKGAALDVVQNEPIEEDNPLLKLENVIITPHISWAPVETRHRLMGIAIDNFKSFVEGNPINIIK